MHPRLQELIAYLDLERAGLRAAVAAVPAEQQGIRPAADRWSVLEILQHIALVERRVNGLLARSVAEARERGVGPDLETSPILPALNLDMAKDRSVRITAPSATVPTSQPDIDAAWRALDDARAAIDLTIASADGVDLGAISQPHMALGALTLYQWIGLIGAHEARHADQIREVGTSLRGDER